MSVHVHDPPITGRHRGDETQRPIEVSVEPLAVGKGMMDVVVQNVVVSADVEPDGEPRPEQRRAAQSQRERCRQYEGSDESIANLWDVGAIAHARKANCHLGGIRQENPYADLGLV